MPTLNRSAQKKWDSNNLAHVKASYKKEFVQEFKEACKQLGKTQSEVIREAMQRTIKESKDSK